MRTRSDLQGKSRNFAARLACALAAVGLATAGLAIISNVAAAQTLPEVSVLRYDSAGVSDGDTIRFAFSVTPVQTSNFDLDVAVAGMHASAFGVTPGNSLVRIPANERFGHLVINTTDIDPGQTDKTIISATEKAQSNGYISVTIRPNSRYTVPENAGISVAEVRVYDTGETHDSHPVTGVSRCTANNPRRCAPYEGKWDPDPSVTVEVEAIDTVVVEGQPARFRIKVTPYSGRALRIAVRITHSGGTGTRFSTVGEDTDLGFRLSQYSHGRYTKYSYITLHTHDDQVDEPIGQIGLVINPYSTLRLRQQPYTLGASTSASVTVTDNDLPRGKFTLDPDYDDPGEGDTRDTPNPSQGEPSTRDGTGDEATSSSDVTVVVANGWSSADSSIAALLAAQRDEAVVLYVQAVELPSRTRSVLAALKPAEVIIVGGTDAVSAGVESGIATASGAAVIRVAGPTRFETAADAAPAVEGGIMVVANGHDPSDQGIAAALAGRVKRGSVVYTLADSLPDISRQVIVDLAPQQVIVVGGEAAVSNEVLADLTAAAGDKATVQRVSGASRDARAAAAARLFLPTPVPADLEVVLVNGWSPPDIAAAVAFAARAADGETVLLAYAAADSLPTATAELLADLRPARLTIIGGTAVLSTAVETAARAAAPAASFERIAGTDRVDTAAKIAQADG